MSLIRKIVLSFVLVFIILGLVSLLLPSDWKVERSLLIKATPEEIFPYINTAKKWELWSPWTKERDMSLTWQYEGAESGEGAVIIWKGDNIATGRIDIFSSKKNSSVLYNLTLGEKINFAIGHVVLVNADGGTIVTWGDEGDVQWNMFGRLLSSSLDQVLGPDFELGLNRLKVMVESNQK